MYKTNLQIPFKHVTWECTSTCNYKCSYCWPKNHDGLYRWPTSDQQKQLINAIQNFRQNMPLSLDIMGGEPTLWPGLIEFCKKLGDNTAITFSTNASRSLNWWKKFDAPIDDLIISWHPEFANDDHVYRVTEFLCKNYKIKVLLMDHPAFESRIEKFYTRLFDSELPINCSIKLLQNPHNNSMISKPRSYTGFSRGKGYNFKFLNSDWLVDNISTDIDKFYNSGFNKFQGWICDVGKDYMYIFSNGDVSGSACQAGGILGNIYNNYTHMFKPQICPYVNCRCKADVKLISRKKHDENAE